MGHELLMAVYSHYSWKESTPNYEVSFVKKGFYHNWPKSRIGPQYLGKKLIFEDFLIKYKIPNMAPKFFVKFQKVRFFFRKSIFHTISDLFWKEVFLPPIGLCTAS